jgi:hypothetical protein
MGEAIARQQPPVVLRSQLDKLRALLVVALIAVCGLTVAVGILASDSDEFAVGIRGPLPAGLPQAGSDEGIRGPLPAGLPQAGSDEGLRGPLPAGLPKAGSDEGIRGPLPAGLPKTGVDAAIGQANRSSVTETKDEAATAAAIGHPGSSSATETKDEAATAAAIGQSNDGTVTHGSKTDPHGPASLLP